MPPTYFPLRWESTGDQWWYASPIDWAAANGHYDLVRELLRLDSNHLIKLTSLRRIRRLETVWDDEEQFHGVAKCRASVARRLFHHCEPKKAAAKNSLIRAGYGGWLIYTAASAGDLSFVHELLERNPLLVFGEGEYGVTDVLYAAARSKSCEVFRLLLDYASAPRFAAAGKGGGGDAVEDVPRVYKWEMINRAVHAAARGGNLRVLKELLANCSDVLAYRDAQGSTILHTAAGRGQVEIVKFLIEDFDTIITSTDHHGNTALHVAAYRGQLAAAEALISALPSSIHLKNSAGETFLHKAVSGFQTLQFRRLDRQIELLKQLVRSEIFNIRDVVNAKNNEDRTALHTAVIGNVHSDLVQLLMMADSIDVNAADADGMTPLDYLKQKPRSASSDVLIRQLISAGAIFGSQDYNARKIIVSRMKMQAGNGSRSPGSSFRISDAEIFLYTGIENAASSEIGFGGGRGGGGGGGSGGIMSPASLELSPYNADETANFESRRSSFAMFKQVLNWPKMRDKKNLKKSNNNNNKSIDYEVPIDYQTNKVCNSSSELEPPTPLRKRFSKPSSPNQSNKRTLAVRSNQSSPSAKKKLASGMRNGVMQAIPRRSSRSSSFSKSSISSPSSLDKQKGICIEADIAGPSCSINNNNNQELGNGSGNGNSKRLKSQYYLCFGNGGVSVKSPVNRQQQQQQQSYKLRPVSMVA